MGERLGGDYDDPLYWKLFDARGRDESDKADGTLIPTQTYVSEIMASEQAAGNYVPAIAAVQTVLQDYAILGQVRSEIL